MMSLLKEQDLISPAPPARRQVSREDFEADIIPGQDIFK